MSRSVTQDVRSAIYARETDQAIIMLLTFDHDDLDEPIRLTPDPYETLSSGSKGVISNGLEYTQLPMEVILDNEDENVFPTVRIKIDNIAREIIQAIRSINTPPKVSLNIVMSSNVNVSLRQITDFELINVTWDAFVIEGELTVERLSDEPFGGLITPTDFPGLQ
ncbi:DUF1833 family protein [Candidatus Saccharibacteria bacterium]|nr:DUF1833 family protein [Candidatus Saccharibacteria bacterium]